MAQEPITPSFGMRLFSFVFNAVVLAIFLAPVFLFTHWRDVDRAGYAPHLRTVDLYIQGEWFKGEQRVCSGIQSPLPPDVKGSGISSLHCPIDPYSPYGGSLTGVLSHTLSVLFWGRVSRPGIAIRDENSGIKFAWNCTRSDDSFVCRAVN